jgi:hypothetical protein
MAACVSLVVVLFGSGVEMAAAVADGACVVNRDAAIDAAYRANDPSFAFTRHAQFDIAEYANKQVVALVAILLSDNAAMAGAVAAHLHAFQSS